MIDAKRDELRKACLTHLKLAQAPSGGRSAAHYLLLFYAAECALKAQYLATSRRTHTGEIPEDDFKGHDLAGWVKGLRLPPNAVKQPLNFKLERECKASAAKHSSAPPPKQYAISEAHQAWRYGMRLEATCERELVQWLDALLEQLKEHLR